VNPEFDRNLWLEAAPRRIVGLAVVLTLIYGGAVMLTNSADPSATIAALGVAGAAVFAASGLAWAAWAAGGSILDEIRGRTWEFQRLSALTPWEMTWGKLFGAGALAWLSALTGLMAIAVANANLHGPGYAVELVILLIGLAVFVQACAMGAALIGVRKARAENRTATGGAVVLGVFGGLILLSMFGASLPIGAMRGPGGVPLSLGDGPPVRWWGQLYPSLAFTSASVCVFAGWALTGAWRLMRLELQMRNSPWVWVGFLLFAAIWRAGLAPAAGGAGVQAMTAALVFIAAAYICAFVEPADAVKLRRFMATIRSGALLAAVDLAPAALFAVKLAGVAVIVYCLLPPPFTVVSPLPGALPPGLFLPTAFGALAALAFMVRDLGVITLFRFGPRAGRGDLTAVIALALLYWVGGLVGRVFLGESGRALFSPLVTDAALISLISGAGQAVFAWVFALRRLRGPNPAA
jgi:hypothetical protein